MYTGKSCADIFYEQSIFCRTVYDYCVAVLCVRHGGEGVSRDAGRLQRGDTRVHQLLCLGLASKPHRHESSEHATMSSSSYSLASLYVVVVSSLLVIIMLLLCVCVVWSGVKGVVVASVEAKTREHLDRQCLGSPLQVLAYLPFPPVHNTKPIA